MPDNKQSKTLDQNSGTKLYKPEPIRRGRARDYSHWQQKVLVQLKTDTAQRFLERHFRRTNAALQRLDYLLVIMRDDAFAEPFAQELGTMFSAFIDDARGTIQKLQDSVENTTLPFTIQEVSYDNARTYEAVLLSGYSVDMLTAIVELDNLSMMIDTARGKRVLSTFNRKNLLEQWVDTLTKISVRRVQEITSTVLEHSNELRKEREERQAKELQKRERERARQEKERNQTKAQPSEQPADVVTTEQPNSDPDIETMEAEIAELENIDTLTPVSQAESQTSGNPDLTNDPKPSVEQTQATDPTTDPEPETEKKDDTQTSDEPTQSTQKSRRSQKSDQNA